MSVVAASGVGDESANTESDMAESSDGDPKDGGGELKTKIQEMIDYQINPAVAGHGGFIELLDYKDGVVYLRMGGGCQGCGMANVTLKQGIERMIREEIPEVQQIVDTTDHAGGTNPYYQPSK
jgi:Fe/S biogenesis protein NfuA